VSLACQSTAASCSDLTRTPHSYRSRWPGPICRTCRDSTAWQRTGTGCPITLALADAALAVAGNLGFPSDVQVSETDRPRTGNPSYGHYRALPAAALGAYTAAVHTGMIGVSAADMAALADRKIIGC
jgi:hypothetical protein